MKMTYSALSIENDCQLIAAELLVWSISRVLASGLLMPIWPDTTFAPVGLASAKPGASKGAVHQSRRVVSSREIGFNVMVFFMVLLDQ